MGQNKPVIILESYFFATLVVLPPCMLLSMAHSGDIFGVVMYSIIYLLIFSLLFLIWALLTIIPLQHVLKKYKGKWVVFMAIGAMPGVLYLLREDENINEIGVWAMVYGALLFGMFQHFLERRGYNKTLNASIINKRKTN